MNIKNSIDNPKECLQFIQDHLKPKEVEKKKYGEVFTPMSLVEEMLDKLPEEVWSNSELKWFDPANGMGNFPIAVYYRLMKGLSSKIKNEEKRKKHIIENMLYMSELNKKNCFMTKQIFDPEDKYQLNLFEGDTLDLDPKKEWSISTFNIIMGNPPYQDFKGSSNGTLWDKFVLYSLKYLKDKGYITYVHPSGWRNVNGKFKKLQKIMFEKNIIYLEIHNEKEALSKFRAETRFDWYLLQNTNKYKTTQIKFEDESIQNINIRNFEFIPNGQFGLVQKLLAKKNEEKCEVLHSYSFYDPRKKWMSITKSEEHIYPCVYTINNNDEIKSRYSSKNLGHIGKSKLMWSNGRIKSIGSVIDEDGVYGLTCFAYAIVDKIENLKNIKKAFDSQKFRKLMEHCAVGQLTVNYKIIALFKKDFWREFI